MPPFHESRAETHVARFAVNGFTLTVRYSVDPAIMKVQARTQQIRDLGPALRAMAGVLREEARARFAEGGRSPSWKRLAASTIAAKAIAGLPARTAKKNIPRRLVQRGAFGASNVLIASGRLRDSWGVKNDPNHIEIIDVRAGTVRIGSKLPYASAHQKGTKPYWIYAKKGLALAFTVGDGKTAFAQRVHHPGLPRRAVTLSREGIARLREILRRHLAAQSLDGGVV